ncbi:MAG: hypothetical protein ACR2FG_07530 [Marmoricola sp.]
MRDWPEEVAGRLWDVYAPDWVVPTTHPSAVLRSRDREGDLAVFVGDLQVAAERLAQNA